MYALLESEVEMGAFALQVYTFDEFNTHCHASFAAKRKAVAAGEVNTWVHMSFATAGSNACAQLAYRKGRNRGERQRAHETLCFLCPGGGRLEQKVGECLRALQLGRAAPAWLVYVEYVTAIITQGLCNAALTSYSYMHLLVISCRSLCVCPFIGWCPFNKHHPISC